MHHHHRLTPFSFFFIHLSSLFFPPLLLSLSTISMATVFVIRGHLKNTQLQLMPPTKLALTPSRPPYCLHSLTRNPLSGNTNLLYSGEGPKHPNRTFVELQFRFVDRTTFLCDQVQSNCVLGAVVISLDLER